KNATFTIPVNGTWVFAASPTYVGAFIGPLHITSTNGVPVSAVSEVSSLGDAYGIAPMTAAVTSSSPSFAIPRFEYNSVNSNWNTNIGVLNASGTAKATFTATFYDQSGQQAAQASSTSLPAPENAGIDPDRTWIIGTIPTLSNETNPSSVGIPSGF